MEVTKDSIVLYKGQYEAIKDLALEDKGRLLDALFHYASTNNIPEDLSPVVRLAFSFIRNQMDIDLKKYLLRCERNKENARKRWQDVQLDATVCDGIPHNANGCDRMQMDANHADKDKDKDKDKEESKDSKIGEKSKRFIPPSLSDVQNYISENQYSVNASAFIDFYIAKGWMVGKNKMKDWKAAIRTWQAKEKKQKPEEIGIILRDNNPDKYDEELW